MLSVCLQRKINQHLPLRVIIAHYGLFLAAAEAILLGFQHYLVMLGTTVLIPTHLVPQMGGGNVRFLKEIYHHDILDFFMFYLWSQLWFICLGGEGKNDTDNAFCGWIEHIVSDILWYSFTCSDRRLLYLCANNHFDHLGRSIQ